MSKVEHIHAIDDGLMSDQAIAQIVGCHVAYVRCVRNADKRRSARQAQDEEKKRK